MIARRLLIGGGGSFTNPPNTVVQSGARTGVRTGTGYKAFPGMCIASDGRWHAVYRQGSAHNNAGGTINYITSDDDGATWDPPNSATILYTAPGLSDARDPFIMETSTGRLLVGYDHRSPWNLAQFSAWLIYSDDGGSTWSSEYQIPVSSFTYEIVTSQPIEVGGNILIPGFAKDAGGVYKAVVWISTDNGATVSSETVIGDDANDFEETQIRLLASGRIVALMRDSAGGVIWRSVSSDNGATWSTPAMVLTASGRPDFVEITPGLLFMQCRNNTTQFDARFTYSTDEGLTWAALAEVDAGATTDLEYSAPVVTSDGNVAVLYSLENSSSDADLYLRHYVAA